MKEVENPQDDESIEQYVSLPEDLLDRVAAILWGAGYGASEYVDDLHVVAENIDEPVVALDSPQQRMREIFCDLELLLPAYIDLLAASVKDYGAETYSENLSGVPLLLLSDGSKAFPLLQDAAMRVGVSAEGKVRNWYLALAFVMQSHLGEQVTGSVTKH